MGSIINLSIGRLSIDWGKNNGFYDYSPLFKMEDLTEVPYYYADDLKPGEISTDGKNWKTIITYKEGLSKLLKDVIDRVNLLGHTLQYCKKEYNFLSQYYGYESNIKFDDLVGSFSKLDVSFFPISDTGTQLELDDLFWSKLSQNARIVESDLELRAGESLEFINAFTLMQLFAQNPLASNLPVIWAFKDLAENGWAPRSSFVKLLDPTNQFLIVTEGSSDASILKHAFSILKPHIADFFTFVDMEEGYPFSGTGNLINFVKGLISIAIQNNVIVLFDNDAEGAVSFNRCKEFNLPDNMKILKLPNLKEFETFPSVGPGGMYCANINGKAASIECYLDIDATAAVRWTMYNSAIQDYHGILIRKDDSKRAFLTQRHKEKEYDYSKIEQVLEMIIANCIQMKESTLNQSLSVSPDDK